MSIDTKVMWCQTDNTHNDALQTQCACTACIKAWTNFTLHFIFVYYFGLVNGGFISACCFQITKPTAINYEVIVLYLLPQFVINIYLYQEFTEIIFCAFLQEWIAIYNNECYVYYYVIY